jgi:hypothetical protein
MEFHIRFSGLYSNPFDPAEVEVNLQLTTPNGQRLNVPAFYGQDYERRRLGTAGAGRGIGSILEEKGTTVHETLSLSAPAFVRDLACHVGPYHPLPKSETRP